MKTLLLWDIDGTLIDSGGAGVRALRRALQSNFGINSLLDDIEFAGRTDRWIIRQVFLKFGIAPSEENFAHYFDGYLAALPDELKNPHARVLPGVSALLARTARQPNFVQGLLTGNLRRGAEAKLSFHGLWTYFSFGAFADDAEHRDELGPHALERAHARAGTKFSKQRIWVIGDTPHDIACGKAIGAQTLAVATGRHSIEELALHTPSKVVQDLTDGDALIRLMN